jgi:heme A synthase
VVLIRPVLLLLAAFGMLGLLSPASAHENHQKAKASAAQVQAGPPGRALPPSAMQEQMEQHMEDMEAQEPKSFPERLVSWFGRMHPFAVHFPIALFPVALVALVLARRRGETVELIRAMIVVAGVGSVIAATLGWLNGGLTFQDTDQVLMLHRWLGMALGVIGGVLAFWAWRRRDSIHGRGMVVALGAVVALLLVQGFLGASVTHGMEHMMF